MWIVFLQYSRLDNGFRYHMGETYPVQIDQEELKRVFDNLFTNTVKYRTSKQSCIQISLKRTLAGTNIELVFKDDGPGVPEDSLEQIFDSFYRVDDARTQSEKGSGIGLAVVKEIIIGHKGNVRAENRDGLAIIIHLPIVVEDTHGKILIVEDDALIAELERDYLVKPFSPTELVARVKSHIHIHNLLLESHEEKEETEIAYQNPNIVFSKDTLFDRIWGMDSMGDVPL